MPWSTIKLNDGNEIPNVAYGTWKIPKGEATVDQVGTALEVGFDHIDTAQAYLNQEEVGVALSESGLKREDIFITTKFSGRDNLSIAESMNQSLDKMGVDYVDLYLIHSPRLVAADIAGGWAQMLELKEKGLAKSVGVSNFAIEDLEQLKDFKTLPAVNQILFHPYVYEQQRPLVAYCDEKGIVIEAYSPLIPVTSSPGGPVDVPLAAIALRTGATFDQILLAWAKAKGTVVVTNSSKKERMEGYLRAGDIELTDDEIKAIDLAGKKKSGIFCKVLPALGLLAGAFLLHTAVTKAFL